MLGSACRCAEPINIDGVWSSRCDSCTPARNLQGSALKTGQTPTTRLQAMGLGRSAGWILARGHIPVRPLGMKQRWHGRLLPGQRELHVRASLDLELTEYLPHGRYSVWIAKPIFRPRAQGAVYLGVQNKVSSPSCSWPGNLPDRGPAHNSTSHSHPLYCAALCWAVL